MFYYATLEQLGFKKEDYFSQIILEVRCRIPVCFTNWCSQAGVQLAGGKVSFAAFWVSLLHFWLVFWIFLFFAGWDAGLRCFSSGQPDTNASLRWILMQASSSYDCWEIKEDAEPFTTISCWLW